MEGPSNKPGSWSTSPEGMSFDLVCPTPKERGRDTACTRERRGIRDAPQPGLVGLFCRGVPRGHSHGEGGEGTGRELGRGGGDHPGRASGGASNVGDKRNECMAVRGCWGQTDRQMWKDATSGRKDPGWEGRLWKWSRCRRQAGTCGVLFVCLQYRGCHPAKCPECLSATQLYWGNKHVAAPSIESRACLRKESFALSSSSSGVFSCLREVERGSVGRFPKSRE